MDIVLVVDEVVDEKRVWEKWGLSLKIVFKKFMIMWIVSFSTSCFRKKKKKVLDRDGNLRFVDVYHV